MIYPFESSSVIAVNTAGTGSPVAITISSALKEVSEKLEKGDFIGMALDKFFGLPVFEIDNKLYLFWNELYDEIMKLTENGVSVIFKTS